MSDESKDLLARLDQMLKDSKAMKPADRYGMKRHGTLRVLLRDLGSYKNVILDQLVTVRQMERALDGEIKLVERMR